MCHILRHILLSRMDIYSGKQLNSPTRHLFPQKYNLKYSISLNLYFMKLNEKVLMTNSLRFFDCHFSSEFKFCLPNRFFELIGKSKEPLAENDLSK